MRKEFIDFFNNGYIKIFFIGRFYVLRDGYAEFFNVFRKRKEYFAIVEKMPLDGSEMSISEESGYWELEELIKQKVGISSKVLIYRMMVESNQPVFHIIFAFLQNLLRSMLLNESNIYMFFSHYIPYTSKESN